MGFSVEPSPIPPGDSISFDPALVGTLVMEHARIERTFMRTLELARTRKFPAARKSLETLRALLTDHLIKERGPLSLYLMRAWRDNPDAITQIRQFEQEMRPLRKQVMEFLDQYTDSGITPDSALRFVDEGIIIARALATRIRSEETALYPLYRLPAEVSP